ncbi:MAG: aldo/keto reductase [Candidatus Eremiobacteraeota bacterium]|nr:aldo/keto reductase [Candidatus Eremiobacteraeota bacterium]
MQTFTIGGDLEVTRLGFGAMRVTGEGIWGEPADPAEARRVLRRVPELGVNFIDTADSDGPFVSEDLLAETLHPYRGITIATKGGLVRTGPGEWSPVGDPEYLRQCVLMSMRRLRVERIDLWQLHRIDPKLPREEQFGVIGEMQKEGLIRHVGLSEVDIDDIDAAAPYFKVATVQNRFNLIDRGSEDVLDYCERMGIGFIPWFPLAAGDLSAGDSPIGALAKKKNVTAGQLALAWLLKRSPVMLPIPGTGSVKHLEENVAAAELQLDDVEFEKLNDLGRVIR